MVSHKKKMSNRKYGALCGGKWGPWLRHCKQMLYHTEVIYKQQKQSFQVNNVAAGKATKE